MESLDGAGLVGAGAAEKSDLCNSHMIVTTEQIKACSGSMASFNLHLCAVYKLI